MHIGKVVISSETKGREKGEKKKERRGGNPERWESEGPAVPMEKLVVGLVVVDGGGGGTSSNSKSNGSSD